MVCIICEVITLAVYTGLFVAILTVFKMLAFINRKFKSNKRPDERRSLKTVVEGSRCECCGLEIESTADLRITNKQSVVATPSH